MNQPSPEEVGAQLHALLRCGQIDAAALLYEEDALFLETGGAARGRARIRAAHEAFVDAGLEVRLLDAATFVVGDIALVHWAWAVELENGETLEGVSAEVLRRQADGRWLYVIDNSDGAAMLEHRGG